MRGAAPLVLERQHAVGLRQLCPMIEPKPEKLPVVYVVKMRVSVPPSTVGDCRGGRDVGPRVVRSPTQGNAMGRLSPRTIVEAEALHRQLCAGRNIAETRCT